MGSDDVSEVLRAGHLQDEPSDPAAVAQYLADDRNVFFLAYDENTPVGFLRGTELGQLKSPRRQMFLYEIAVSPGHQRHGVGTSLVRSLLNYCVARDFEEVFVFTDPANLPAVQLYRSTGAVTETPADRMFVYRLDPAAPPPAPPSAPS